MDSLILIAGIVYLVPTMIVAVRGHRNGFAIVLLNILAGWTGIGWLIALIMAVWVDRDERDGAADQARR